MRAFLGLATYYRRFIKDFSQLASPLNLLLRKNEPFKWTTKQEEAFKLLKTKLTQAPILARPDFKKKFTLYTDASAIGLGAVLSQHDEKGNERVILYTSRGT